MKSILLVTLIILSSLFLFNDDVQVCGKITDSATNSPIQFAKIIIAGTNISVGTDKDGYYCLSAIQPGKYEIIVSAKGYKLGQSHIEIKNSTDSLTVNIKLDAGGNEILEDVESSEKTLNINEEVMYYAGSPSACQKTRVDICSGYDFNTEEYNKITENGFKDVISAPVSTFSIDVDGASYSNCRRYIDQSQLPPADAVRAEEFINYFDYKYLSPKDDRPFSVNSELSDCPWNKNHKLFRLGIKGEEKEYSSLPPSNLVFLIDVSGSMDQTDKLPLLKKAFKLLVNTLREKDMISIVVYAGSAGIVLEPTKGSEKTKIIAALEKLQAGGSTAGGEGIELAYNTAKKNFIKGGNNRVILATDGDFNIGVSSTSELTRLIEKKMKDGIYLTCLGFGMGNYKDGRLEELSNKGNGNGYYIDNLLEAKKVLVDQIGGTLYTIAKDVKLQVEFNPSLVKAYRLVGYENRLLNREDFNDDKKDAGELGAGHTVTALYEIIPAGSNEQIPTVDSLKYQKPNTIELNKYSKELLTCKIRYKKPNEDNSILLEYPVDYNPIEFKNSSEDHRFAGSVAAFAQILRNSEFKGDADLNFVLETARNAKGDDTFSYREDFIRVVKMAKELSK